MPLFQSDLRSLSNQHYEPEEGSDIIVMALMLAPGLPRALTTTASNSQERTALFDVANMASEEYIREAVKRAIIADGYGPEICWYEVRLSCNGVRLLLFL